MTYATARIDNVTDNIWGDTWMTIPGIGVVVSIHLGENKQIKQLEYARNGSKWPMCHALVIFICLSCHLV